MSRNLIRFIGISYAIFKLMQVLIDSNRGLIKKLSLLSFLNFILFFPTFISGPILRYNEFNSNFKKLPASIDFKTSLSALYRIFSGLLKTLAISPFLFQLSISVIPDATLLSMPWYKVFIAMYAYGLYIYIDFSGYCDMAIGTGSLMGIHVPENFINPLKSRNIQEFWMRWHVSLSQWLRDYLYYPSLKLIMKTVKIRSVYIPAFFILLTFFIMGIWHDLTIRNVYYGLYHGGGLALFMIFSEKIKPTKIGEWMNQSRVWHVFAVVLNFHFYFISFLVFTGKFNVFFKSIFS